MTATGPESGTPRVPRGVRVALRLTVHVGNLVLIAYSVACLLARSSYWGELCASFRWQAGVCGGLLVAWTWLVGPRRWAFASLAAWAFLWAPHARAVWPAAIPPTHESTDAVTFLTANVLFSNEDHAALHEFVRRESPDVLAVQEITPEWIAALDDLKAEYPHRVRYPELDEDWKRMGFGLGLYTRLPVESTRVHLLEGAGRAPMLELVVVVAGRRHVIRTLHSPAPWDALTNRARNRYLAAVSEFDWDESSVLLGDFNASRGSPVFADLLERSGLSEACTGFGRSPTWATDAPLRGLEVDLDHVLVGRRGVVTEHVTSAIPGSDHRALRVRIVWPDASTSAR